MVGLLVKWRTSWLVFLVMVVLAAWGDVRVQALGKNFGVSEQHLVDVVVVLNLILPFVGFFFFRNFLASTLPQPLNIARTVLVGGIAASISTTALLFAFHVSYQNASTPGEILQFLWRLSNTLLCLVPIGLWRLAEAGGWKSTYSTGCAIIVACLSVAMLATSVSIGSTGQVLFGPAWALSFIFLLFFLCGMFLTRINSWLLLPAIAITVIVAYLLRFSIFFAGVFYGGGMLFPLLFALTVLCAFVFRSFRRGDPKLGYR